jgi:hypothetical protein
MRRTRGRLMALTGVATSLTVCTLMLSGIGIAIAPAQAATTYTICTVGEPPCLNSPGFGGNVNAVISKYASYQAIAPTTWVNPVQGGTRDVAEQQVGKGPNCLEWNGTTGAVQVETCTGPKSEGGNGATEKASQEWWWDTIDGADWLVNVYATAVDGEGAQYGAMWYGDPGNSGIESVGVGFESPPGSDFTCNPDGVDTEWCWHSISGNYP